MGTDTTTRLKFNGKYLLRPGLPSRLGLCDWVDILLLDVLAYPPSSLFHQLGDPRQETVIRTHGALAITMTHQQATDCVR